MAASTGLRKRLPGLGGFPSGPRSQVSAEVGQCWRKKPATAAMVALACATTGQPSSA